MSDSEEASGNRLSRVKKKFAAAAAGGLLALIVVLGGMWAFGPTRLSPLQAADLQKAVADWKTSGPDSYDLEVEVQGAQPGVYQVSVRKGTVESASFNGRALTNRRTMGTWSVPGMLNAIEMDLGNERLMLRGEFDSQCGLPRKYLRVEGASPNALSWQVRKFAETSSNETAE